MSSAEQMYKNVFDLLLRLHEGLISPEQAMSRLMPLILACETQHELDQLEPLKDLVLSWYEIHPETEMSEIGLIEN